MWWLAGSVELTPDTDDWLTSGERTYADRQRYTKRRVEFRAARFTAKSAIAQTLGLPRDPATLSTIEIRHEPSGAPYACVDGEPIAWQLSLTDRADWAVCLLSNGTYRVGCDLELVEPRTPAFVEDYFTIDEQRYVARSGDSVEHSLVANLIWSAKESALKVLTTGLRRDTRSVEVRPEHSDAGWGRLNISTAEGTTLYGWWQRYGSFVLTVASAEETDAPAALNALLDTATPSHGWLDQPFTGAPSTARDMPRSSAPIK
jgi:4'-phosphopantetheinyl transferase